MSTLLEEVRPPAPTATPATAQTVDDQPDTASADPATTAFDVIHDRITYGQTTLGEVKNTLLAFAMNHTRNITQASKIMQVGRSSMYRKMDDLTKLFAKVASNGNDVAYAEAMDTLRAEIFAKRMTLRGVEEKLVLYATDDHRHITSAAKTLGVGRSTFYRRLGMLKPSV